MVEREDGKLEEGQAVLTAFRRPIVVGGTTCRGVYTSSFSCLTYSMTLSLVGGVIRPRFKTGPNSLLMPILWSRMWSFLSLHSNRNRKTIKYNNTTWINFTSQHNVSQITSMILTSAYRAENDCETWVWEWLPSVRASRTAMHLSTLRFRLRHGHKSSAKDQRDQEIYKDSNVDNIMRISMG